MNLQQAMQQLEEMGTAQNRKVYARHGVSDEMFGVSYANLNKLAKAVRKDHSLSLELWATGNHDARVLATMVADPSRADESLLEEWLADLDSYVITDAFSGFAGKTAMARVKGEEWINSDGEWPGRVGWHLVAHLAMKEQELSDTYFTAHLATIEGEIHARKNRVRDAMNSALIAIGIRNDALEQQALTAAARIGKVVVDHGETGCKTPDAAAYIRRTLDRRRQKAATAANKAAKR
jgi:3-methyladenine DNA glycosylase AlkD